MDLAGRSALPPLNPSRNQRLTNVKLVRDVLSVIIEDVVILRWNPEAMPTACISWRVNVAVWPTSGARGCGARRPRCPARGASPKTLRPGSVSLADGRWSPASVAKRNRQVFAAKRGRSALAPPAASAATTDGACESPAPIVVHANLGFCYDVEASRPGRPIGGDRLKADRADVGGVAGRVTAFPGFGSGRVRPGRCRRCRAGCVGISRWCAGCRGPGALSRFGCRRRRPGARRRGRGVGRARGR